MAQQLLQGGQIRARFHEVGGKGMAQGMTATRLGTPRTLLGRRGALLGGRGVQRHRLVPLGKHPRLDRALPLPVVAYLGQEPGPSQGRAILTALALLDPDHPPLGVDITHAQPRHLTDAQAPARGRHQQRPCP